MITGIPTDLLLRQIQAHAVEAARLVVLLRETIDRRFAPDSVIESALQGVEYEQTMLCSKIKRLTGEGN